ncbi:MAG: FKBP-type peptidyl-prolyl cis-trans isomerase [Candidatus Woesearchaeota archaeon]|nr:FKBP-type peptidyl-prolyl cis-trans isomerase [Candidatus Woesearchaeota archaeon]
MDINGVWEKVKFAWSFVEKHALLFALLAILLLQFAPNGDGKYPWGGVWMRMQVQNLPFADSAAASTVENYITQQVSSQVQQNYPNLPEANRQKVVDDLKKKFKDENKVQLEQETKNVAQEIREHYQYDANGTKFLYMPDIDPYFYLRFARNLLETGHTYDELKEGKPWDNHMVAPIGTGMDTTWHSYTLVWLYKIGSVLNKQTTLMQSAAYFPVVFIFLSLIFAFLIAYRVSGPVGGVSAATMLAVLPAIMGRTPWGHADTDAYTVFFAILIVWLLFEALSSKSAKKQVIFGGLTGLAFGIYANFWNSWWYLFDFVGAALAVAIVADIVIENKLLREGLHKFWAHSQTKKFIFAGVSLFVITAVVCSATIGFSSFYFSVFKAAFASTALKNAAQLNLWPNTLTTVAELNPGSFTYAISSVGGNLIFLIGVLGIVLLLIRRDEHGRFDFTYSALLAIWFAGTMYMTLKGMRFTLLLGPAAAIAFGAGVGLVYKYLSGVGERQLHIPKIVTGILIIIITGLIIVNPSTSGVHMVRESYATVTNDVPLINDAWWTSLTKIKDESQPNAIINSWWDFGHHFKYIADRAVSFDGASQTMQHAHWVGRVLQTDNEDEAVGILRMLDCGSSTAYSVAYETLKDHLMTVRFIKKLIMLDDISAQQLVEESGVSDKVLELAHCNPPEDFFIASGDMISKAGVWAHFGLWNFEKAETWLKWKNLPESEAVPQMMERFNVSEKDAKQTYDAANNLASENDANQWISPWPGYATDVSSCSPSGDLLNCGNIVVNLSGKHAEIRSGQGVAVASKIVVYDKKGDKKVLTPEKGGSNLAVVVWPTRTGMNAIAANDELADSMFTRMYFMGGLGLKQFKPFSSERQLVGGWVHVYKVNWTGDEPFIPGDLMPKTSIESGAQVSLDYIAWIDNDQLVDSSIVGWREKNISRYAKFEDFETKPMSFTAGQGKVVAGFESRIMGMKPNETKTFTVPPEEAYGTDSSKHPLGNKTMNFKVKIESVQ